MKLQANRRRQSWRAFSALALSALLARPAGAVLLYSSATRNTSAPTGTLSNSGWQYEGQFGNYLGTPIAPHYFVTAGHVGGASSVLVLNGVTYTGTKGYTDTTADLSIWHVLGTFNSYAPMYTGNSEMGQTATLIGRGTQRGSAVNVGATLK